MSRSVLERWGGDGTSAHLAADENRSGDARGRLFERERAVLRAAASPPACLVLQWAGKVVSRSVLERLGGDSTSAHLAAGENRSGDTRARLSERERAVPRAAASPPACLELLWAGKVVSRSVLERWGGDGTKTHLAADENRSGDARGRLFERERAARRAAASPPAHQLRTGVGVLLGAG